MSAPPRYVFGSEGRLAVSRKPPRRSIVSGLFTFFGCLGSTSFSRDADGLLSETPQYNRAVFARELPEDSLDAIAAVDAEIAPAMAKLKRLEKKRQAILLDAAQRGARARAP